MAVFLSYGPPLVREQRRRPANVATLAGLRLRIRNTSSLAQQVLYASERPLFSCGPHLFCFPLPVWYFRRSPPQNRLGIPELSYVVPLCDVSVLPSGPLQG